MDTSSHGLSPLAIELRLDLFVGLVYASSYGALMLLVFGSHTDDLFPWAMSTTTAGTLGAAYAGSVVMCLVASRARDWPSVRGVMPPVAVVTVGVLIASGLERGQFRLQAGPAVAFVAGYAWFAVHIGLTLLLARGVRRQRALGVGDPVGALRMPWPMRGPLLATGWAAVTAGTALFVLPGHAAWWPWQLSPLDARVLGLWAVALGIGTLAAERECDLLRARPGLCAVTVTAALALWVIVRDTSGLKPVGTAVYLAVVATMMLGGLGGLASAGSWSRRSWYVSGPRRGGRPAGPRPRADR